MASSAVGRKHEGRVPRDEFAPAKRFKARGPHYRFGGDVATPAAPGSPRRRSPGARLIRRPEPARLPRRALLPSGSRPARGLPREPRVSHLLAVRGRALLPQATPVEQVPRLQVQGTGPRQQRPGRAAVRAHGSGRRRRARRRRGRRRGRRPPRRTRCPRPESRARGWPPHAAGPRPALGTEGGRTVAEGKDALAAAAAAATAAAALELTPN